METKNNNGEGGSATNLTTNNQATFTARLSDSFSCQISSDFVLVMKPAISIYPVDNFGTVVGKNPTPYGILALWAFNCLLGNVYFLAFRVSFRLSASILPLLTNQRTSYYIYSGQ